MKIQVCFWDGGVPGGVEVLKLKKYHFDSREMFFIDSMGWKGVEKAVGVLQVPRS